MSRKESKQQQRWPLDMQVSRSFVQQLLKTASEFDLSKNGLYDGRSGCVKNIVAHARLVSVKELLGIVIAYIPL